MGKKKKFIDKKSSATFQLMARDTSDPNYSSDPSGDRIFVRVDNNSYVPGVFMDGGGSNDIVSPDDPNSIFADAPEYCDDENGNYGFGDLYNCEGRESALPDHVRKEILELGFPDDGYNYLTHLREIKNAGGGSAYYHNPKASFNQIPQDVKAYDSSRVDVRKINDVSSEKSIYSVASRTFGIRLQKVVDPELEAILDDSDSKFGSDVEELEEDFVVKANLMEGPIEEDFDKKLSFSRSSVDHSQNVNFGAPENVGEFLGLDNDKPRVRRPLDDQFDLLELQEYGTDNEEEHSDYVDEETECQESLAEKLNQAFKGHPSNLLHDGEGADDVESTEVTADVIHWCKEYAVKYDEESHDDIEVFVESSEESESWDCETIVSTYSTFENQPGIIGAPELRRKKLAETLFGASGVPNQLIALKGKEKLPVDFLPHSRKLVEQKSKDEKDVSSKRTEPQKRKAHGQESKEEKKDRKSAVKLERREARQRKKEMKGIYNSEAQHAKKFAAFTGPSSIHLM